MARKVEHPAKGWAAGYRRISVAPTDRNQDSPETHERLNREAAVTHGFKIKPGYDFYDPGITASKDVRRPELEKALRAVANQEVEALVVPALDRLTRRGMRHIGEMLDAVEATGIPDLQGIRYLRDRKLYQVDPDSIDCDLWQFQTALQHAHDAEDDYGRAMWLEHARAAYRWSVD